MIQPSEIISDRTIPIKNEIAEQEQSSRQKSAELLGLPNNISNGDFEEVGLQIFEKARIKVMKRNFHAMHWLWNRKVIKDLVSWQYQKVKRSYLYSQRSGTRKLTINKRFLHELLYLNYKCILGKCNSLLKKKDITSFYTINGKCRIIYEVNIGNITSVVNHEVDLATISEKKTCLCSKLVKLQNIARYITRYFNPNKLKKPQGKDNILKLFLLNISSYLYLIAAQNFIPF